MTRICSLFLFAHNIIYILRGWFWLLLFGWIAVHSIELNGFDEIFAIRVPQMMEEHMKLAIEIEIV